MDQVSARRQWLLGASDPEMAQIARLLSEKGEQFNWAAKDGRPVTPATAYKADRPAPAAEVLVLVECRPVSTEGFKSVVVIDHHNPGDPGYGLGPDAFLMASSLGQALRLIYDADLLFIMNNWYLVRDQMVLMVPEEVVLCAAADHCLGHAYRGRCKGVDPGKLRQWRAKTRAEFQQRPVEDVLADVERARQLLREAKPLAKDGPLSTIKDMTSAVVPELPEAAVIEALCFVSVIADRDGRRKLVCQAGEPEQIEAFLEWARGHYQETYGDPARGFAGAYLDTAR